MRHAYQMPFSPGGEFVWNRKLAHNGEETQIGQAVDKALFTPLRLRQLYESRMIVPAPFGEMPPPRYLNNGLGKADKLRAEIEREEAEAAKISVKGESDAQPRSDAEPAAPRGARAAKPADVVGKKPAERLGSKPAAKSAPKRAAARSR